MEYLNVYCFLVFMTLVQSMTLFKAPSDEKQIARTSQKDESHLSDVEKRMKYFRDIVRGYRLSNEYNDNIRNDEETEPVKDDKELGISDEEYREDEIAVPDDFKGEVVNSMNDYTSFLDNVVMKNEDKKNRKKEILSNFKNEKNDNTYIGEQEKNNEEEADNLSFTKFSYQPKKDITVLKMNRISDVNRDPWDELKSKDDSNYMYDTNEDKSAHVHDNMNLLKHIDDGFIEYDDEDDFE